MLKNQNFKNDAFLRRINKLFKVFAVVAFALALHAAANAQTGVIQICKAALGAGLENKVFQFQVTGISGLVAVPVGGCSQSLNVPAGMITINETRSGFYMDRPGTFSGGFQLLDVSLVRYDESQPNPLVNKNPYALQATLNVQEGGFQNETVVLFTNAYAAEAWIEICNNAVGADSTRVNAAGYAFNGFPPNHQLIANPGTCHPLKVYLPKTPGSTTPATGTVRITQYYKPGFTLESVTVNPAERFNSLTIGTGIIDHTNPDCLFAPEPTAVTGCTFNNPNVGYADVDVVEGVSPTTATKITFNNRVAPARLLKICKIAGAGVPVGTPFTFDFYINDQPEIGAAPITVTAGDPAQGGNCVFAQGQLAPYLNGVSSFPANSTVTVVERAATGYLMSAVSSSSGVVSNVDLAQRKAAITIGDGINILTFTNVSAVPVSAPTSAGTNVGVAPTTNLNLNFGNVSAAGDTTVTPIPPGDAPPVPSGFALSGSSLIYEITTSAAFSGSITVSFDVPNVADAAACSQLTILHYTNGAWDTSGNAAPVYNNSSGICTVSQVVTSLSPFAVGRRLDSDNDGVPDITDAFPFDPDESVDTDRDGTGNNADADDDNDGQSDESEIACGSNSLDSASKCAPPAIGPPTDINQCKNGGWKVFETPRRFKNQGDCILFVNTGK